MKNQGLVQDYITRAESRILALNVLFKEKSWPDVVREAQEVVELVLKALLRFYNIEVPRVHDVGPILLTQKLKFKPAIRKLLPKLAKISHSLRRDRELSFYGSEDLTPLNFYSEDDAGEALKNAKYVVILVSKHVKNRHNVVENHK